MNQVDKNDVSRLDKWICLRSDDFGKAVPMVTTIFKTGNQCMAFADDV